MKRIGQLVSLFLILIFFKSFLILKYKTFKFVPFIYTLCQDLFLLTIIYLCFLILSKFFKNYERIIDKLFLIIEIIIIFIISFNLFFFGYFRVLFSLTFLYAGYTIKDIYGAIVPLAITQFFLALGIFYIFYWILSGKINNLSSNFKKRILAVLIILVLFSLIFYPINKGNPDMDSELSKNIVFNLFEFNTDNTFFSITNKKSFEDFYHINDYSSEQDAYKYNIVLFYIESLGAKYLYEDFESLINENIKKQFSSSMVFKNIYSVYPLSSKDLPAFLCSVYPSNSAKGIILDKVHKNELDPYCLPDILNDNGYETSFFHTGDLYINNRVDLIRKVGFGHIRFSRNFSQDLKRYGYGVDERFVSQKMLDWIDAQKKPFFTMFWNTNTHYGYHTPDETIPVIGKDSKSKYLRAVKFMDGVIGNFIDELEKRDMLNSTIIIIVGDHGEAFQEHEGNYIHTIEIYEGNMNVPLIFINKELFHAEINNNLGSVMDVGPTILKLLGISDPIPREGQELISEDKKNKRTPFFYTNYHEKKIGLRYNDYKYIYNVDENKSELYDLKEDPFEKNPLIDKKVEAYLFNEIKEFLIFHNDEFYNDLSFLEKK